MAKTVFDALTASSRVYIDTNIFIYFLERAPQFFEQVKNLFEHIDVVGAQLLTSEITVAECIYRPSQLDDQRLIRAYELLFEESNEVDLVPLDGLLAKQAALHGSQIGLKLIDSIHLVSALQSGCDYFVSSDARFKSGPRLNVIQILPD
jgi:predicted nucleic acid-binding protein